MDSSCNLRFVKCFRIFKTHAIKEFTFFFNFYVSLDLKMNNILIIRKEDSSCITFIEIHSVTRLVLCHQKLVYSLVEKHIFEDLVYQC